MIRLTDKTLRDYSCFNAETTAGEFSDLKVTGEHRRSSRFFYVRSAVRQSFGRLCGRAQALLEPVPSSLTRTVALPFSDGSAVSSNRTGAYQMPKQKPVSNVFHLRAVPRPAKLDEDGAAILKHIERHRDIVGIFECQLEQHLASKQVAA